MNARSIKKIAVSKTNWTKLHKKSDKDIDYSDIPETNEAFWKGAELMMPHPKTHLSVRFDEDIVAYFKRGGRGYQSRMNAVLRGYMNSRSVPV